MSRIVPLTGTEEQRQLVLSTILPNELHTTSDQKRVFLQNAVVCPVHHGTVANEAAMLALRFTSPRGCFPGDTVRVATAQHVVAYVCVSRNGQELIDWTALPATLRFSQLTDVPSSYSGFAGRYVRVNDDENALIFDEPGGGGGGALYEEATIPELEITFSVGSEFSRTGWVYGPGHVNASSIASALDNNTGSIWQSGTGKVVGMRFSVDMLTTKLCSRFRINHQGVSAGDRATLVTLETSTDGTNWTNRGNFAVSTSVDDSDFDLSSPVQARYFRLVIVTTNGSGWWSINEIRAYEANVSLVEDAGGLLELTDGKNAIRALVSLDAPGDGVSLAMKLEDPDEASEFLIFSATWASGVLRISKFRTFDDTVVDLAEIACGHFVGLADMRQLIFGSTTSRYIAVEIKGRAVAIVPTTAAASPAWVGGAKLTAGADWEFTRIGTDSL